MQFCAFLRITLEVNRKRSLSVIAELLVKTVNTSLYSMIERYSMCSSVEVHHWFVDITDRLWPAVRGSG